MSDNGGAPAISPHICQGQANVGLMPSPEAANDLFAALRPQTSEILSVVEGASAQGAQPTKRAEEMFLPDAPFSRRSFGL